MAWFKYESIQWGQVLWSNLCLSGDIENHHEPLIPVVCRQPPLSTVVLHTGDDRIQLRSPGPDISCRAPQALSHRAGVRTCDPPSEYSRAYTRGIARGQFFVSGLRHQPEAHHGSHWCVVNIATPCREAQPQSTTLQPPIPQSSSTCRSPSTQRSAKINSCWI